MMIRSPTCHRCGTPCHKQEEELALGGKSYHKRCFTCAICGNHLDSMTCRECREHNEIFCKNHYQNRFGIPGYGYGSLPALLTQNRPNIKDCYDATPSPSKAYIRPAQPEPAAGPPPFVPPPALHARTYFTPSPPGPFYTNQAVITRQVYRKCSPLSQLPVQSSRSIHAFGPPKPSSQRAGQEWANGPPGPFGPSPSSRPKSARPNFYSNTTGREYCFRCGKEVFWAEKAQGYRGVYHKRCFYCDGCHKSLDPKTVHEDQGRLFCRGCYTREGGGPTGVGFGVGAGTLRTP